jgi:hypothetical protein
MFTYLTKLETKIAHHIMKTCQSLIRGVSLCGLAIYIKKDLLAKNELRKLKYFTMQKYMESSKILFKNTQIFQDIIIL